MKQPSVCHWCVASGCTIRCIVYTRNETADSVTPLRMTQRVSKKTSKEFGTVGYLRVAAWYFAVQHTLGVSSAYAVERIIEPRNIKTRDGVPRANKWGKYRDGKHTPSSKTVELAEAAAPGTKRWISSAIWRALDGRLENFSDVEECLIEIDSTKNLIFSQEEFLGGKYFQLEIDLISQCINLNGLDFLEAVILILEAGLTSKNPKLQEIARIIYEKGSHKLASMPQFVMDFPRLFNLIETRYFFKLGALSDPPIAPWYIRLPDKNDPRCDWSA